MDKERIQNLLADLASRREMNRQVIEYPPSVDMGKADSLETLVGARVLIEDQRTRLQQEQVILAELEVMLRTRLEEIDTEEAAGQVDAQRRETARVRAGLVKRLAGVTDAIEKSRLLAKLAEIDREGVNVHVTT